MKSIHLEICKVKVKSKHQYPTETRPGEGIYQRVPSQTHTYIPLVRPLNIPGPLCSIVLVHCEPRNGVFGDLPVKLEISHCAIV